MPIKIKSGMKFNYNFADGISEWVVLNKEGSVWICQITNKNDDWEGTVKPFFESELVSIIDWQNNVNNLFYEQEKWYNELVVDSIVHYNNGFENFVRCKVVLKNNKKELLPIALVGNWQVYDLPRIDINGEIYLPYYPNKIFNKETFTPNFTCVYESPAYDKTRDRINPINEKPIDLTIPEQTPEEKENSRLNKILYKIDEIVHDTDTKKEKLEKIYSLIKNEVNK